MGVWGSDVYIIIFGVILWVLEVGKVWVIILVDIVYIEVWRMYRDFWDF